jgi:hypothetical protein
MSSSELAVIDWSVFAGSRAVYIGRAVYMRLVPSPVVDQVHWKGGMMLKLLVGGGRKGSGTTTIPDLGRNLASLLSPWTRWMKRSSSQLRTNHQNEDALTREMRSNRRPTDGGMMSR